MPDIEQSIKLLGQLVGVLDKDGNIQWTWFGDPESAFLNGLPANRDFIGELLRELLDQTPDTDAPFADLSPPNPGQSYVWVPFVPADPPVNVGAVWSKGTPELRLGIGAKTKDGLKIGSENVSLAALARLIDVSGGSVTPKFTDLHLAGTLAPPDFLKSIAIEGDTDPLQFKIEVSDLKPTNLTLAVPGAQLGWDSLRLVLFLVRAWIRKNAGADAVSGLVDQFFALLDGPPAFPLTDPTTMGTAPNFGAWASATFPTTGSAQSALAFMWRLRTLITGSQDATFLTGDGSLNAPTGSLFFPLRKGQPAAAMPTNAATQSSGVFPGTFGAGASLGILNNGGGSFTLVLDIHDGTNNLVARLPLAKLAGGSVSLPTAADIATAITQLNALAASVKSALPFTLDLAAGSVTVHLFHQTLSAAPLNGDFDVSVTATSGNPLNFRITLPNLPAITIPPAAPNAQQILANIVSWIPSFLPKNAAADPKPHLSDIAGAACKFLSDELTTPSTLNVTDLLALVTAIAGGTSIDVIDQAPFDLSIAIGPGNVVTPKITYGPLSLDQIPTLPMSIGKLNGSVDIAVDGSKPFSGFSLGFDDLRLGTTNTDGSDVSGLIASLIPDLKQAPGFHFELDWTTAKGVAISGGGKIPIQLTLGPLSLSQLLVDAENSGLTVGINLSFQLSVITVNTYELGMTFDFHSKFPSLALNGLGLSFDGAGISLSGLFLNNNGDYIGGAAVAIEDMFSLSAIGGYKKLPSGASLFIFASLMAPLGGPPFFFVTGIAGGFGYNRMLPPATLMSNHPFFKIMSGQIPISTDPKQGMSDLTALDDPKTGFAPKAGDYWIAAGIQFISFGFINGKVILAVAFGHDFSIDILGVASFGINPVAYFEIDILVTVDQEKFLLIAGVSPNSYLIHPDIFNLSGDFGLGVWHSGPHADDFLVSIGGFHPYFKAPDYYPQIDRVSVKAVVFGFVHLTIECFFACTPQALMAGASVSLSATFAGIGAGLDVYVDVLIQWDPFFILATMGVTVWFEFMGRHEIGVDLMIHTPPFGGVATIHLFIISFDVSFGDNDSGHPTLPVADFFTRQLGVPATPTSPLNDANVALFNTATAAGLVKIVFTSGRTIKQQADSDKAQDGTTTPVQVSPEFEFVALTHLPIPNPSLSVGAGAQGSLNGTTHLPLCLLGDLSTSFTVAVKLNGNVIRFSADNNLDHTAAAADITATDPRNFPAAQFGGAPLVAQADNQSARQAVAGIDTSHPAIPMIDGLQFNMQATPSPDVAHSPLMQGPEEELSLDAQNYPLPLGGVEDTRLPQSKLSFAASAGATAMVQKNAAQLAPPTTTRGGGLRLNPGLLNSLASVLAPKFITTTAPVNRPIRAVASKTTTVASVPSGLTPTAPPASPARRVELANVVLRCLPAHTAAAAQISHPPIRVSALSPAVKNVIAAQALGTPVAGAATQPTPPKPSVTVTSGEATHIEISSDAAPHGSFTFAGQQTVRAVFMTAFGEPVSDQYIAGNQTVQLPARSRNVLLIGEGSLAGAPASLGCVGAEPGSTLYAVGARDFAGHGCVVRANSAVAGRIDPGQTVTGSDVLGQSSSLSFYLPPPPKTAAVLITVSPAAPKPAAAPTQVRWRAVGATLSNLKTAVAADRAAFVMDVQGAQPWNLDIDLGPDWTLASAVLCNISSANVLAQIQNSANWSFVDDSFVAPPSPMSTTVTLEVTNG